MLDIGSEWVTKLTNSGLRTKHIITEKLEVEDGGEKIDLYTTDLYQIYFTEGEFRTEFMPVLSKMTLPESNPVIQATPCKGVDNPNPQAVAPELDSLD